MDPNLNSDDENPYDFIFRQDKQVPALTQNFGNKNRQIIIFVAFVAVILILVSIVFSIISSSGKDDGAEVISVRAYQNEIQRVIDIGNKNLGSSELQKKLTTLELVLITDQGTVTSVLNRLGVVATSSQLNQYQNSNRDAELTNSLQVDNHDAVYEELIDDLATGYYESIRTAQGAATTQSARQSLSIVRDNIETIYGINIEEPATDSPDETTDPVEESDPTAAEPGEEAEQTTQSDLPN